jgi:hypothetical protein
LNACDVAIETEFHAMIVVSNDRDWIEQALDGYAQTLTGGISAIITRLRPPNSKAADVQSELKIQANADLFFFGHGYSPPETGFVGNDGNPTIDDTSVHLLAGRRVAATCCHGERLGALAKSNGFSMFGYAGKLALSRKAPSHINDMQAAALAGPREIAAGGTVAQAAAAARREYGILAQNLLVQNDWVFAAFASMNASASACW